MSRRGGGGAIQSTNVLQGPRKRLRGNNDASTFNHDAPAAFAASSSSGSSTATMGTIERKIHSLSVQQVTQYGQKLMDTIIQAIDPSDRAPLHEFFLQLPDAQEYPDYYEIIKRPMALEQIQQKLDQHSYAALPDVKHDFETICNNAKRYNLRDTPVWLKAKELHSLIKITYVHILQSLPEPSANPPPPPSAAGAQSTPTRSKRITIRTKQSSQKLNDQLQPKAEPEQHQPQILTQQQQQQQHPQQPQPPQPQQHDGQQSQPLALGAGMQQPPEGPFTAAGTPSTQAGDDDDDDDDDDAWENDGDSSRLTKGGQLDGRKRPGKRGKRLKATLRQLVYDLRRVIGTRGYPIVQHFDYLPDRNQVPQYYQVIQKPICLRDIEHRAFHKSYINAHALFSDLELMLTNAITFYPPDSPIWQDAQEIRQYFEQEAIPALFQDGFTLEKDDVRQSALPLHLAANSTIEAHKSAYKMIVSKAMGGASQSPEPSSRSRLGSAGVVGSPALSAAPGLPLGSPAPGASAFGSPSPAAQPNPTAAAAMMGTPSASPAPMMGTPIGSMPPMSMPSMPPPMSTPGSASMSPLAPGMPGTAPPMGMLNSPGPGRALPYPGTPPTSASPSRPTPTCEGRRPVGRPPGKSTPSRSNPYPFLERRIGPGRPKKHEAAARQAAIAAHEEMLRKMALENQQDEMSQQQQQQQQQAAAFGAQSVPQWGQQQMLQQQQLQQQLYLQQQQRQQEQQLQRQQQQQQRRAQQAQLQQQQAYVEQQRLQEQQQMLPPGGGAPAPFGAGMAVEAASPAKRKEAVLPVQEPRSLAFEGLESRTPLISNFAIDMEVEAPDGQTLAVPSVEIKNGFTTQHSLQIPPNASSITIEFPLRILKKPKAEDAPADDEEDVSMSEASCNNAVANRDTHSTSGDAAEEEAKKNRILTYPWRPELSFNGKQTTATWVAADSLVETALQEEEELGYSYCKVRLLPKRGINVLEINVKPAVEANGLQGIPDERYSIFFC